jgi:hypothetical protein
MTAAANPARGEAQVGEYVLRPSFTALVAAEAELGPLFALVERAAAGELKLSEMVALFWHCRVDSANRAGNSRVSRAKFAECVTVGGLAAAMPALKTLIGQILAGR